MSALRANHPVFRRRRSFSGEPLVRRGQDGLPDIAWFTPKGVEMTEEDWGAGFAKSVAVFLNGHGIPDHDARGQRVFDDAFLLCFNAHPEPIEFAVPLKEFGATWNLVVYTGREEETPADEVPGGGALTVDAHTAVVLQAPDGCSAG